MIGKSDLNKQSILNKARKSPIDHSSISDHFEGECPIFINFWQEGFELREHDHAYLEIVYIMSGEGYHFVNDQIERTTTGNLYILPVGLSHIFRPIDNSNRKRLLVYNLGIIPNFITKLKDWMTDFTADNKSLSIFQEDLNVYTALYDKDMQLGNYFDKLYREYSKAKPIFNLNLLSDLLQILAYISTLTHNITAPANIIHIEMAHKKEIWETLEFIDSHLDQQLTVEQMAKRSCMSKRHFIRLFKLSLGMGFSQYLQKKRVNYACSLLLQTDYKISYIAKKVGYQDIGHFRKVFHNFIGVTPTNYRKRNNSNKL